MKNIKHKALILVVVLSVVISIFAIPSFALDHSYYGSYTFAGDLVYTPGDYLYEDIYFTCGSVDYTAIHFECEYGTGGYHFLEYISDEKVIVWDTYYGWYDDKYRHIFIDQIPMNSKGIQEFLTDNDTDPEGWFYDIQEIITSAVFGTNDVTDEAKFSITLISLILSLLCLLLPVLMVFGILIWIMKRL